jgi:hypothetical protein
LVFVIAFAIAAVSFLFDPFSEMEKKEKRNFCRQPVS